LNVKQFLASKSIRVIQQHPRPPNSPDLAPADFSSLPKGETGPKSDSSDIQRGVTELLKGVSLQDFQRSFEDLYLSVV
jgi:hypothetical protein